MLSEYLPSMKPSPPTTPPSRINPSISQRVADLLAIPGNEKCADCTAPLTVVYAWAVLAHGIFVCADCKLIHIELSIKQNAEERRESGGK